MPGTGSKQELLSVTAEQRGHAAHLRLFGEIDMATAPVLQGWLHAAESNGNSAIVVDLEQVTFIDSSGLHAFLGAAERAIQSGRIFAITKAPAVVQRVLRITGSTHLLAGDAFTVVPDRHPAEPSFAPRALAEEGSDVPGAYNQRVALAAR